MTAQNNFKHGFENEIEGYYQIDASHGLIIQPDVKYWQNPGGGTTANTLLVLTRITYTF